ncbi:hypothetical protein ACQCSX_01310 [Pseudarthrobacter sp. P1]|uniref:hypothetical protein n=1 Tax=Pseudarthrobacter sp. P1 TaxID=3418418 RepID=UPI003CEBAFC5
MRNAKPVSVVVGGALVVAGCLGMWLAAILSAGPEDGKIVVFALFFAIGALVQGIVLLSWDRRSKSTALMRMQVADVLPGIMPLTLFASIMLSVPGLLV